MKFPQISLRGLVSYALVGHSERRHIFGEAGREIGRKVQAAIRHDIRPVLCVGETAMERHDGETNDVIHDQLVAGLANVTSEDMKHVVIAYEPVWAIGTGNNAMPDDVEKAIEAIRRQVQHCLAVNSRQRSTGTLRRQYVSRQCIGILWIHVE